MGKVSCMLLKRPRGLAPCCVRPIIIGIRGCMHAICSVRSYVVDLHVSPVVAGLLQESVLHMAARTGNPPQECVYVYVCVCVCA